MIKRIIQKVLKLRSPMQFDRFGGGKDWWLDSRGQGCLDMERAIKLATQQPPDNPPKEMPEATRQHTPNVSRVGGNK